MSGEALFPVDIASVDTCLICGAETGEPIVAPCACGPVHIACGAAVPELRCALCGKEYATETRAPSPYRVGIIACRDAVLCIIITVLLTVGAMTILLLPATLVHAPIQFDVLITFLIQLFFLFFTIVPPVGIITIAVFLYEFRDCNRSSKFSVVITAFCADLLFLSALNVVVRFNSCDANHQQWCTNLNSWMFHVAAQVLDIIRITSFCLNLTVALLWAMNFIYRTTRENLTERVVCNREDPAHGSV